MSDTQNKLEAFLNQPPVEYYELINGDTARRGRKIDDMDIVDSGKVDLIVVLHGNEFYIQFGEGKLGYDCFGHAHPADDPFFAPLDCSKCGK